MVTLLSHYTSTDREIKVDKNQIVKPKVQTLNLKSQIPNIKDLNFGW